MVQFFQIIQTEVDTYTEWKEINWENPLTMEYDYLKMLYQRMDEPKDTSDRQSSKTVGENYVD
jgi:tRNA uridine 5-carbamoylmethylation protein Kti12